MKKTLFPLLLLLSSFAFVILTITSANGLSLSSLNSMKNNNNAAFAALMPSNLLLLQQSRISHSTTIMRQTAVAPNDNAAMGNIAHLEIKKITTTFKPGVVNDGSLSGWSGFTRLGDYVIRNPGTGIAFDPVSRIYLWQVFTVGADHQLYYRTQGTNGAWSVPTGLGGYIISNPVVGFFPFSSSAPNARLELFVVGRDHQLYYNIENTIGVWSGFIPLGGYIISDPATTFTENSAGHYHTEVYAVGDDNGLLLNRQDANGVWSGFTNLGGYVISNPTAVFNIEGRAQVFVVGRDNALYTAAETSPGSDTYLGFTDLGGYIIGNPVVGRPAAGPPGRTMEVFVVGGNNHLYHNGELASTGTGTWSGFEDLGGYISSDIFLTGNAIGEIQVFVVGPDHALYHLYQIGSGSDIWSGFEYIGGYIIGKPAASGLAGASAPGIPFELLVVGPDHALYYNANPTFPFSR